MKLLFRYVVVITALLLFGSTQAWAEPPGATSLDDLTTQQKEELVDILAAAKDSYSQGDFARARELYEQAWEYYREPRYLHRIAVCLERTDELEEAIEYYRRYLKADPDSSVRGKVETTIASLEEKLRARHLATLRVRTDPPEADVFVGEDERLAGKTPIELTLPPGTHRIAVRDAEHAPRIELVELSGGAESTIEWKLQPLDEPDGSVSEAAKTPSAQPVRRAPTGLILAASGAALATAGAGVGWYFSQRQYRDSTRSDARKLAPLVNGLAATAWAGAAATAVLTSLTIYRWTRPGDGESPVSVRVLPIASGTSVGLGGLW